MAVNESNQPPDSTDDVQSMDSPTSGDHFRGPDLSRVDGSDWTERSFPLTDMNRPSGVPVVIKQSVLNSIHKHGQTETEVEIGGFLVGKGYRDETGPFVYVEAAIEGITSGQAAQVTFTAETWDHAQRAMDERFPDLRIIGWYHTHPDFGVFLSDMDLFIHKNFFGSDEQLALVYDPIRGDEGLFVWRGGEAERDESFLVELDAEVDPPVQIENVHINVEELRESPPTMTATAGHFSDLVPRIEQLEKQQKWASYSLWVVTALAIVWPISYWHLMGGPELKQAVAELQEERSRDRGGEDDRRSLIQRTADSDDDVRSERDDSERSPRRRSTRSDRDSDTSSVNESDQSTDGDNDDRANTEADNETDSADEKRSAQGERNEQRESETDRRNQKDSDQED